MDDVKINFNESEVKSDKKKRQISERKSKSPLKEYENTFRKAIQPNRLKKQS